MIQLPSTNSLTGIERYAVDLLVDLSRLLPARGTPAPDLVRLEIDEPGPGPLTLADATAHDWYLRRSEGAIGIPRSVLALVGAIAAGKAEQESVARDKYDRVPPSENPLVAAGLEGSAVVSRVAGLLRSAVLAVAGSRPVRLLQPWPEGRRWAAAATHDLDLVTLWPAAVAARIAELLKKGKFGLAASAAVSAMRSVGRDPVWHGVQAVLEPESRYFSRSTWFVICETPTLRTMLAGDVTYPPESHAVRRILRDLTGRGCEIALHGSFATSVGDGVFERQAQRLTRISGSRLAGVRQHFLRMRPGATHDKMRAAGFLYDSTWGFSDRNGFRLGVADVLPGWDAAQDRLAEIELAPFCWMDRALSKYQAVEDPKVWVDEGLARAAECRAVEGLWVGVWHPNMYPGLGFPGAQVAFERLMAELAAQHPFFGSLSSLVHWRVARRSALGQGIGAGGQVDAVANGNAGHPMYLEDGAGRRMERVTAASN